MFVEYFVYSALVETDHVIAIDCDTNALIQAQDNVNEMELNERISFVQAKVPFRCTNNQSSDSKYHSHSQRSKNNRHRSGGRTGGGRYRSNPQHPIPQRKYTTNTAAAMTSPNDIVDDLNPIDQSSTGADHISSTAGTNDSVPSHFPLHDKCVDTVVTNPPFGTKGNNAGIDIEFVLLACQLARRAVYSFHKTTTRDYVLRTIQSKVSNIQSVNVIAEMKFNISNTYQFHQQKSVDIAVDLIRVEMMHI